MSTTTSHPPATLHAHAMRRIDAVRAAIFKKAVRSGGILLAVSALNLASVAYLWAHQPEGGPMTNSTAILTMFAFIIISGTFVLKLIEAWKLKDLFTITVIAEAVAEKIFSEQGSQQETEGFFRSMAELEALAGLHQVGTLSA